ncbi:MAG: Carbohydrate binding family 6 [Candidatus Brocadiaceae bacterium]|nr:Carbohydrate binding family 6 [Candidatus Brocadiaceae bacterium]
MYATNASGSWVKTTVDSYGGAGECSSIALDTSGNVHVSYADITEGLLKYATNASGAWANTDVGADSYNSLALDTSDGVHIGYFDTLNYDRMYTSSTSNTGRGT